jgi:hypothetical protein
MITSIRGVDVNEETSQKNGEWWNAKLAFFFFLGYLSPISCFLPHHSSVTLPIAQDSVHVKMARLQYPPVSS